MLMVDCPHCGKSFSAAIQDERTFAMMRVERLRECCPSCFHGFRFTKAEYYVPDEGPTDPFRPTR
jgi:hypothetical protein